eukprot:TRINITY_DN27355_c0_g1_i1.p1 TRINITY_DN27355_c0_g1~~TRINITY_DN27355_c0_g1_i1.p1  ORF type:complete len:225 (+),score=21.30 TRINITY_DN27355_c0_g1_i1:72-746(+)
MGIFSTVDPSALFCFACIIIPLYKEPETTDADRLEFLTDPFFYCPVLLLIVTALVGRTRTCIQTETDKILGRWYLWNGAIIHIMMDGCVGSLDKLKLFSQQYKILDHRFVTRDVVPVSIGLIELYIMAPLCLLLYLAFKWNLPCKNPLEIIVCVMHAFGAIMFVLPEHLISYKNVAVDYNLEFSLYYLTYFWFGFLANFIWVVVPLYNMKRAFIECCSAKVKAH